MSQPLPTAEPIAATAFTLSMTGRAIDKVKEFASKMPEASGKSLRVFIQGGGCSGFQYGFTFDDQKPTDNVVNAGDISVLVDPASAQKLHGSTVDWIEDMRGAGFSVDNPNSTSSCGCGKSFC
jgi:iron-sulfur cluster assembly accessory protein